MKKYIIIVVIITAIGCSIAMIPMGSGAATEPWDAMATEGGPMIDLSQFSEDRPEHTLRLLFIHHSTGGQLLADHGESSGDHAAQCIYNSHPNGGGLRKLLRENGYDVHEASYGSIIGEDTNIFDWLPKFRDHMDHILTADLQDDMYSDERRNQIILFKSCFPNSDFREEGQEPGNSEGPELTVWNAKATFKALLEHFSQHPDVLFVYFTAPPLAPPSSEPLWKWLAKKILKKGRTPEDFRQAAAYARQFNNWVRSPEGWLRDYPHRNVIVFDYFDVLTNHGESNYLLHPTGDGSDSHPSARGQQQSAVEFVPFLNRAIHRAGLHQSASGMEDETAPSQEK